MSIINTSELQKVRDLSVKATAGKWQRGTIGGLCQKDHHHRGKPPHGDCEYVQVVYDEGSGILTVDPAMPVLESTYDGAEINDADLDFIVAACNFVRELLA